MSIDIQPVLIIFIPHLVLGLSFWTLTVCPLRATNLAPKASPLTQALENFTECRKMHRRFIEVDGLKSRVVKYNRSAELNRPR